MILFISVGGLFITGDIGIEVFSAHEVNLHSTENTYYSVPFTIEELCKTLDIVIFSYTLMRYIEKQNDHILFHLK